MLTVNYKSHVLFSYLKLALENHKLNNELCEAEYQSLQEQSFLFNHTALRGYLTMISFLLFGLQ